MAVFSFRRLAPAALICSLLLSGCARAPQAQDSQFLAMDTVMSLTAYGPQAKQALEDAQAEILRLEGLFSVTDSSSELYTLNHSGGEETALSSDTAALLQFALEMARETDGTVDPTVYPVVAAWGFTTGEYQVPGQAQLDALLPLVDYTAVQLDSAAGRAVLPAGMELDLGSVAKGWTGDRVLELWRQLGVDSGILRLGGNIQTLGEKPDGSPWTVGVQDPEADGYLGVLSVRDTAVVTSGGYQRYFEQDGQRYWHIMDPATGAPARSGLVSVTVVGPSGARCDALSTALFVMGLDRAAAFWRSSRDFEAVFVDEAGNVIITAGLEDSFSLAPGYEGREVTVLV